MPATKLSVLTRGHGPALVLVHGSAADASTWSIQLATLSKQLRLIAVQRRGTDASPPSGARAWTVEQHADELAAVIDEHAAGSAIVCGSSFGAVIVLDLAKRKPERLHGMVLCEPPLSPSDHVPAVPWGFGCHFDRLIDQRGGPAAAEFFLRTVLTDGAYEGLPARWQQRACAMWQQIRADSAALARYRVDYAGLRRVQVPALLLGGERSSGFYRPTLDALAHALPRAQRHTLRGAGHMMHADAHRAFNAAVLEFMGTLATRP